MPANVRNLGLTEEPKDPYDYIMSHDELIQRDLAELSDSGPP